MHDPKLSRLLETEELAAWLNVSPFRVYSLARQGILPGVVRLGRQLRFDREAIEQFVLAGGKALAGGWRNEPNGDSFASVVASHEDGPDAR
jgi:excisionase family DNA binding protein